MGRWVSTHDRQTHGSPSYLQELIYISIVHTNNTVLCIYCLHHIFIIFIAVPWPCHHHCPSCCHDPCQEEEEEEEEVLVLVVIPAIIVVIVEVVAAVVVMCACWCGGDDGHCHCGGSGGRCCCHYHLPCPHSHCHTRNTFGTVNMEDTIDSRFIGL